MNLWSVATPGGYHNTASVYSFPKKKEVRHQNRKKRRLELPVLSYSAGP